MAGKRAAFDIRQSAGKIAAGMVVLLILNLAAWFLVVRPRINELDTLREESAPRLKELREKDAEVEAGEEHLAALDKATEDLAYLRNEVLATKKERMVKVQLELADLAQQFNIDLESVDTNTDYLAGEGLERFTMVVPLQGGYANLRRFVQAVESSDKFLVIERVAMDRAKDGGALLQMNITLATYFDALWLLDEGDS
jgi:Tfp pilus assembly protein PilO